MLRTLVRLVALGAAAMILSLLVPLGGAIAQAKTSTHSLSQFTVFATGLNNPRGLRFGPDGNLYVAEAGLGGTNSTIGQCQQVPVQDQAAMCWAWRMCSSSTGSSMAWRRVLVAHMGWPEPTTPSFASMPTARPRPSSI